ncbi:hypothetical protein GW17_00004030 [Ensete ventricosum]|nr:hypothetical protein GW17_00004030 [Ensete ventricosum]
MLADAFGSEGEKVNIHFVFDRTIRWLTCDRCFGLADDSGSGARPPVNGSSTLARKSTVLGCTKPSLPFLRAGSYALRWPATATTTTLVRGFPELSFPTCHAVLLMIAQIM